VANVSTPGDTSGFTRYAFEQIDEITVFGGALVVRKREPRDLNLAASMFERELARSQPTSIVVERYSAYMIKHGGPLDRPLNLLKSEVTANPGNQSALALLSKVLAQLGRLDEAAEAANALVALAPAQPTWWLQLADVQGSRNRPDLELAALRRLGELQPDLADVHDRLGAIHERLGDLPAALIAARRASDLQPNSGHFRSRVAELERRA
jgi:predicted Zn-dependent protease